MSLERRPVQIVEIDFDRCTRTYGSAPCTASLSADAPRKCFNTFFTCQDQENFSKSTLTLRFAKNQSGLPKGTLIYPALRKAGTNPTEINLGGIDERTGPLGKRARITVDLQDFADNDTGTDPYRAERVSGAAQFSGAGYDPESLGTFFGRLRARTPYYIGRALRVLDGYAGEDLAAMRTRHYVIDEWEGPDMSGQVRIVAKDVLDLADNKKALCPRPNTGTLAADAAETGLPVFDLQPAGVGDEYAAAGRAVIGSEIVTFTRSGDTITLTGRAMDGSEAASHSAEDLFQQCYRVEKQPVAAVAEDLLVNFAGIDAGFIPTVDWEDEQIWLSGFQVTATIPKPTGVAKLLGELALHGVFWFWDDVAQEVRMRANRPLGPGETTEALSDAIDIVEGSLQRADLEDQRLTQVLFYHGMKDATGSAAEGANYNRARVAVNDAGGPNQYNQERVLEVHSRWLGVGNDNFVDAIASRLVNRFENPPVEVTFRLDAKDRSRIQAADLATISTRALQDAIGQSAVQEMQVISVHEDQPGHALLVKAVTHQFSGRFAYLLQGGTPDYDSASDDDKAFGCFLFDPAETDFGDGTGPYVLF